MSKGFLAHDISFVTKIHFKCCFRVLLKFQTTAPKSCFMRPPGAILAPGETIIATGNIFCYLYLLFQVLSILTILATFMLSGRLYFCEFFFFFYDYCLGDSFVCYWLS